MRSNAALLGVVLDAVKTQKVRPEIRAIDLSRMAEII
jgi:hypothetical protein